MYVEVRRTYDILSLAERRFELCRTFFSEDHKRQGERPLVSFATRRDSELTARLRCARQYQTIYARTNRYKNSVMYVVCVMFYYVSMTVRK